MKNLVRCAVLVGFAFSLVACGPTGPGSGADSGSGARSIEEMTTDACGLFDAAGHEDVTATNAADTAPAIQLGKVYNVTRTAYGSGRGGFLKVTLAEASQIVIFMSEGDMGNLTSIAVKDASGAAVSLAEDAGAGSCDAIKQRFVYDVDAGTYHLEMTSGLDVIVALMVDAA